MTEYKDLYKLPVVPHPSVKPTNREMRRPLQRELIKLNDIFHKIEIQFFHDIYMSDLSYEDAYAIMMDEWESAIKRHKFKYTIPNPDYTRRYTPEEKFKMP